MPVIITNTGTQPPGDHLGHPDRGFHLRFQPARTYSIALSGTRTGLTHTLPITLNVR